VSYFDLNLNTARQFQLHQSIDGLGSGAVNIQQALVGRKFELLPGLLVHKGGTVYREDLFISWQRNRSTHHCSRGFYGFYDLLGRLVDQVVIVRLQFNANLLAHAILILIVFYDVTFNLVENLIYKISRNFLVMGKFHIGRCPAGSYGPE